MKITISINTENAAWNDNPRELRDILKQAERKIGELDARTPGELIRLLNTNGNKAGLIEVRR